MSANRRLDVGNNVGSEQNSSSEDELIRASTLTKGQVEIMVIRTVHRVIEPIMEHLIRRVVKEEIDGAQEKLLTGMKRNSENETRTSKSRSLRLKFLNEISLPVLTGKKIAGEEFTLIKISLVDDRTGQVVNSGPEASAKVEIVVLKSNFDSVEGDNWTPEEFDNMIVREWKGKKTFLAGNVYLNLTQGNGFVGDISFKQYAEWTTPCEFRLGARVVGNCNGIAIKEARSKPFIVKDCRSELYKKRYPPSLCDKVWRLKKIGKDGPFHIRLREANIDTVKDFLIQLFLDPQRLQHILGGGAKMWEATVNHAQTCIIDKRVYLYHYPSFEPKTGVVFNVVGKLLGLLLEDHYVCIDELSETEKANAHKRVVLAFEHLEDVLPFDDENSLIQAFSHLCNDFNRSNSPRVEVPSGHNFVTSETIGPFVHTHPGTYSQGGSGDTGSLDDFDGFSNYNMKPTDDLPQIVPNQDPNSLISNPGSLSPYAGDEFDNLIQEYIRNHFNNLQYENTSVDSLVNEQCAAHGFVEVSAQVIPIDKAQTPQRRWTMVYNVLRCSTRFLLRRKSIMALEGSHAQKKQRCS